MITLEMFPPFQPHSNPSIDAAVAIEPSSRSLRDQVFAYLVKCACHGATDDEMQAALDMNPSTQRPRRIELLNQGKIYRTDITRKTRAGRAAAVWVAHAP